MSEDTVIGIARWALVTILVAWVASVVWVASGQQQVQYPQGVMAIPRDGFLPKTVLIQRDATDDQRICVERPYESLVDCRSVGELRKWIRERPAK
jgi:hypothetical protein